MPTDILGPPHDEKTLRRINPTKKGKEVYTEESALTPRTAFLSALRQTDELSGEDQDLQNLSFPFDASLRISKSEAKHISFFRDNYGFEHYSRNTTANGKRRPEKGERHPHAWRRIDDDWLGVAGELALKLDSYTNNTSLALAIELVDSGKVLLFAADAQVGNWLSWDAHTWQIKGANGATQNVQIGDLLQQPTTAALRNSRPHRILIDQYGNHHSENKNLRRRPPDGHITASTPWCRG